MPVQVPDDPFETHRAFCEDNFALFQMLHARNVHPDWRITLLFYAALHRVKMMMLRTGVDLDEYPDHQTMAHWVHVEHGARVGGAYRTLLQSSYDARYSGFPDTRAGTQL
ncbi:MAG: hypothetical protein NUW37_00490 [Planctomycetes bacterium]|nr:hypothetical protein [Planctomycetota bacterium]